MGYEIRPTNLKHATILPVGQEGEFQIKKNRMFLTFPEALIEERGRTRSWG